WNVVFGEFFKDEIIRLTQCILAAAPPASNLTETLLSIPGNAVRGALARRFLDRPGGAVDTLFRRLFLGDEVSYGQATLGGAQAMPLSARSCKYEPGPLAEGGHGVVDLLLPGGGPVACARCQRPLDYLDGFWLAAERRRVSPATRLATRTAIDPRRGTASAGQLYSQRLLAAGQTFRATVEVPGDLLARLDELVAAPWRASFGTGASRGQGWAEVCRRTPAAPGLGSVRERFRRYAAAAGRPVLAVTLLSDGLFCDDYLRPTTAPALADLAALGVRPGDWQPRPRAFAATRQVFGFDGEPIHLPRPERLAVVAGSAFLFEAADSAAAPQVPPGDGRGWIGDGRAEGYGSAVLWHPFHLGPEAAA
ncbi:MAG TPA: hypothetical protein VJA16_06880, partial [Thermoanaerobaculia bacterium]